MTYKNASYHHVHSYADDTSPTLSAYDPTTLEEKLNKDLDEAHKWLKSNKLTLNVKKTKYMIIGSHYQLRNLNGDLNVTPETLPLIVCATIDSGD